MKKYSFYSYTTNQWCVCLLSGRHSIKYYLLFSIMKPNFNLS